MAPGAMYLNDQAPSSPDEAAYMKKFPFCEVIGSLIYCAVTTHPDIVFVVSTLSPFLDNIGAAHWEAVQHIFCYLAGMKTTELTYRGNWHGLLGYTDADGGAQEHHCAMSGYILIIDDGAISWHMKKQELVTLSTMEVEYVAVTHTAKETIWLQRLLSKLFCISSPLFHSIVTPGCLEVSHM